MLSERTAPGDDPGSEEGRPPAMPRLGVGAIVRRGDSVLLVLRAKPPNEGQWAVPGGRVRLGETLRGAAEREVFEETGIRVRAGEPVYGFEHIERGPDGGVTHHYVVLDLEAAYIDGIPRAADDARDARWVPLSELNRLPVNARTAEALGQLFPEEV